MAGAVSAVLGTTWPPSAAGQQQPARELEKVRAEIEAVNEELHSELRSRDENTKALESIEVELAATTRKLADLNERASRLEARRGELAAQTEAAERRLDDEREALAEQVRMSYMTGRREVFKLLLNQESPATLGRMLVYYDYFNRARSERIESVDDELESLARLTAESEDVRARLEELRAETESEQQRLEHQRSRRTAVLERLDESIASSGRRLESLEQQEQRLETLVKRLDEATAAFPVDVDEPFGDLKGELAWPVQGRVASDFGELRNGGPMRWNGVVLESESGTPVRAVYNGRVAFADWLPGLGLLIIVDHGGGYMSLYGHNQALYKEAGDWVTPGEVIAQVGDSGGEARPALYFEIRRDGDPVDPHEWVGGEP